MFVLNLVVILLLWLQSTRDYIAYIVFQHASVLYGPQKKKGFLNLFLAYLCKAITGLRCIAVPVLSGEFD